MKLKIQMDFELDVCRKAQEKGEIQSFLVTVIVNSKFFKYYKAKWRPPAYSQVLLITPTLNVESIGYYQ